MKRLLSLMALSLGLSSCDSIKDKAIAFLDDKIEETGGNAAPAEGAGEGAQPDIALPGGVEQPVRVISDADFDEFTKTPARVVVVDFYADWCGPCKQLGPILESVVESHRGKVVLGKMNVDNNQTDDREGVSGIPDVRIYVDGRQVDRFVGLLPEAEVRRKIEPHLTKLMAEAPQPAPAPQPVPAPQPAPKPVDPKKPDVKPGPAPKPEDTKPAEEPKIKPMEKDWLPPGVQRKGA